MKSRLKGLLALTLSLIMVFALATNAWGAVWVGSEELTADNNYSVAGSSGTATYDDSTKTLTLNDFVNDGYSGIYATGDLTIMLNGTSTVSATWSGGGHAVFVDDGSLTIEGDGTLTATSAGDDHYALYANNNKAIHINGGEVIANSNSDTAIVAGYVTITGNSTKVTATGSDKGISATYGDSRINDSTVTATGGSTAIDVKNLTISDGTVTATSSDYIGIQGQNITITDGEVAATGAIAGIVANAISITGGTVTANAADNGGVGIEGNSITISGENTTVDVGCETGLAATTVSIAGGSTVTIEATTGGTAIDSSNLTMSGEYQWSTDNTTFTNSTTLALDKDTAATTATLYIKPASTSAPGGGGGGSGYAPPIYYPPVTVDSPKTFDAGIGIYVAMSLLSATGSAYLFKKKD